jgi:hypothetical protein
MANLKDSPFVSEDDFFEVSVNYYRENKKCIVEGIADTFDKSKEKSMLTVKIKYPSHGDCELIAEQTKNIIISNNAVDVNVRDFFKAELIRLLTLIRGWNSETKMNNDNIMNLNPDIIHAILMKIRSEIGTNGIF